MIWFSPSRSRACVLAVARLIHHLRVLSVTIDWWLIGGFVGLIGGFVAGLLLYGIEVFGFRL